MDRKVLIGIGIGIILATMTLSFGGNGAGDMSQTQIEQKARNYGMEYPQEQKVLLKKEEAK